MATTTETTLLVKVEKESNAAFSEGGNEAFEAARILRVLADKIEQGWNGSGPIRDANGNSVGTVVFEVEEVEVG